MRKCRADPADRAAGDGRLPAAFGMATEVDGSPADEFVEILADRIHDLLLTDFDYLMSLAYRMDISEPAFRQALESRSAIEQARQLARLFIGRELQKLRTRQAYHRHRHQSLKSNDSADNDSVVC